jgi:hypothetical protein
MRRPDRWKQFFPRSLRSTRSHPTDPDAGYHDRNTGLEAVRFAQAGFQRILPLEHMFRFAMKMPAMINTKSGTRIKVPTNWAIRFAGN